MKARVRIIDGRFFWPMRFVTGFADVPSTHGYATILIGPYSTIESAAKAQWLPA